MRKKLFSLFLILMVAFSSVQPVSATSSSELKKQRQEKENQKNSTQDELDAINDQISDLSGEKEDVDAQIEELTSQIAEIMVSVDLMEEEIADTEDQIVQAQEDYDAAKKKEEEQYTAMKKRIQYLYEKGENSYIQILLEAKSWGDLLNKAEYVQEIYSYDRKMLDDYAATVQEVADLKEDWKPGSRTWRRRSMSWSRRKRPFRPLWMNRRRFQRITKRILRGLRNRPPHTGKKSNSRTRRYSRLPLRRSPNGQKRKRRSEKRRKKAVRRRRAGKRRKKRRKRASLPARRSRKLKKNQRRQTPHLSGPSSSSSSYSKGVEIANYACQFVGNPYVPGGTSLTEGADCSGFTQSVYKAFGYSIPRTSSEQRSAGGKFPTRRPSRVI